MKVYSQEHSLRYNLQPEFQPISTPGTWGLYSPSPQKSSVVPQNPYFEQHTLSGQVVWFAGAYGPHSAWASQVSTQLVELQYWGPKPQYLYIDCQY
jgi:hypothetical protein